MNVDNQNPYNPINGILMGCLVFPMRNVRLHRADCACTQFIFGSRAAIDRLESLRKLHCLTSSLLTLHAQVSHPVATYFLKLRVCITCPRNDALASLHST